MSILFTVVFELFASLTGHGIEPIANRSPLWARITIALLALVAALVLSMATLAVMVVGWGVAKGLGL